MGEVINHLVNLNQKDLKDPGLNIAAGVRWLFHKRDLVMKRLRREITWEETIMYYKGYKSKEHPQMIKFMKMYQELKKRRSFLLCF